MSQVYQIITDRIVSLLEEGTIPWNRPWSGGPSHEWPANLKTGHGYRGINVFLLAAMGYSSRFWLSFKQARAMGGYVRKGEKGTPIIFWKKLQVEDLETGEPKEVPMLRYYSVFNLDQIDGIEAPDAVEIPEREFSPIERAQQIIDQMPNPPRIEHNQPRAFYRSKDDLVNLPRPELFKSDEYYYGTAFHELTHSTGHEKRLGRRPSDVPRFYGDREYSQEELVAEMGAAFLCSEAGIGQVLIEDQAAYIDNWINVLRGTPQMVIKAASSAQAAADYILNKQNSLEVSNEES